MTEQSGRRKRRRGGRGGANRQQQQQPPQDGAQASGTEPAGPNETRPPRQDTRARTRGDRPPGPPPGPPGSSSGGGSGRTHRAPAGRQERPQRGERDRSGNSSRDRAPQSRDRDRGGSGGRDRGPRVFEPPVPQDPLSIELGARFREAQTALRDAIKALDKRKAEFADEPEWMTEQVSEAERRFAEVATEWSEHLTTTGRKVVRR